MELKPSKIILLLLLLISSTVKAQTDSVLLYNESDTSVITEESDFYPYYHYSTDEKENYQNRDFESSFDSAHWAKLTDRMTFDEKNDTVVKKQKKKVKRQGSYQFSSALKYLWLIPVLAILILLIVRILPYIGQNNIRNRDKLLIHLDNLEEEDLKVLETDKALQDALKAGDYRLAYRLRYLAVLKKLVERNMIVYRKEKTNYMYLTQLSNKTPYEPFRNLTFNFDGIWYGDLFPNKRMYDALEVHFIAFEKAMQNT